MGDNEYKTCEDEGFKCEFIEDCDNGYMVCMNCGVIGNKLFKGSVQQDGTHSTGTKKRGKLKPKDTSYDALLTALASEKPNIDDIVDAIPDLPLTFQQHVSMQQVRKRLPPSLSKKVELLLIIRNYKQHAMYGLSMTLPYHQQQAIIHEKEKADRIFEGKTLAELKKIAKEKGVCVGRLNKAGLIKAIQQSTNSTESHESKSIDELRKEAKAKGVKYINSLDKTCLRKTIRQSTSLTESLESKSLVELRKVAKDKGIKRINSYSKKELIEQL